MFQCPHCGEVLETPQNAKFCTNCGRNLTPSMQKQTTHINQIRRYRRPSPSYRPWLILAGSVVTIGIVVISIILVASYFVGSLFGSSLGSGIEILSDTDFPKYSSTGRGSKDDPYILSNYYLTDEFIGFFIQDTTSYFIIENCTIDMCYEGIHIENIKPGTGRISNNIIFHSDCRVWETGPHAGITVYSSPKLTIVNNYIINAGIDGILLENSPESLISNNSISEVMTGIDIDSSDSSTIANNSIKYCDAAVNCLESDYVKIIQNIFEDNLHSCIEAWDSNYMKISNNNCFNITDTFLPSSRSGIFLSSCDNCTISNCTIVYCQQGIDAYSLSNSSVVYNRIENNSHIGIIFDSDWSQSNTLYLNSFIGNNYTGTAQVWDDGISNNWYHSELELGNYWSDWNGTGSYFIAGSANTVDLYPLSEPPV